MTYQIIPISDNPSQILTVSLGGQQCKINLYQKTSSLYCDLYVNNVLIIGGVICQNNNKIVRDAYLGFIGDLYFFDSNDSSDPSYPGLGSRYQLRYQNA